MNANYLSQQAPNNASQPAIPVAEDNTYHTLWDEPLDIENVVSISAQSYTHSGDNGVDYSIVDNPNSPNMDVRELPVYGLPTQLQNIIADVVGSFQCERDFAVASMLSAAASIIGKRVKYQFCSYTNYPALWLAIVGNSASGKTAPLSFFFKPIEEMERQAFDSYLNAKKEWDKQDEASRGEKPEYLHYITNNPTDEALLNDLAINGSICWKVDELRTMFNFGKYSNSNNNAIVGNLLSIFNNSDVTISRATKDPRYLKCPNLNIVGTTQPPMLKKIFQNSGFVDDGLFQRFLFVYPDGGEVPLFNKKRISDSVMREWQDVIFMLRDVSGEVIESDEAEIIHIDAINRWRAIANTEYKDVDPMVALVRKLEIHLCRLAIIVTLLCDERVISAKTMKYCVECMEYFRLCGDKAYCFIKNEVSTPVITKAELTAILKELHPDWSQSKLAESVGVSQQAVSKYIKNKL